MAPSPRFHEAVGGLLLALLVLGCTGCATLRQSHHPELADGRWERELRRAGIDPDEIANPLQFSKEMQQAARRAIGPGNDVDKLRRLQQYLFNEAVFPFDYDSRETLTAEEAFERRAGNCVSFTNLFIALARSVGLPVRAALVTESGEAEKEGDLVVVNNHIVAVFEHSGGATVFDFNRRVDRHRVGLHIVGDAWITAVYLNNHGAQELLRGRPREALGYLDKAVRLAPEFAAAHGNLGLVRKQLGDTAGALRAYRAALEIEPRSPNVLTNLAALYRAQGRELEARAAIRAADLRSATPFLLVVRADFELAESRHREALYLYRRAARMAPDLAEPWLGIARVALARDRPDRARRALLKALEVDPDHAAARNLLDGLPAPAQR